MIQIKVLLENGWNSRRLITEGDAAISLETTRRAFSNQEKSKQRLAIVQNCRNVKYPYFAVKSIRPL